MTIGQRIKEARKNAGLTQRELAEKSGAATGTIQQYELGKRQPRLEQLRQIALALGTTVSELVEPGYWSTVSKEEVEESWGGATAIKAAQVSTYDRVITALDELNDAGMEKAADMVEIIAGNPLYRAVEHPSERRRGLAAQSTTKQPEAPQEPTEGK